MQKLKEWGTRFFAWHEDMTDEIQWKFNLSSYHMQWIAFSKGIAIVLILQWLF
jgi:hypothetical protein|tara:strand:- start:1210 stop:1368 length:159 start_codon:yes stop_codon:yes gene_type:complete